MVFGSKTRRTRPSVEYLIWYGASSLPTAGLNPILQSIRMFFTHFRSASSGPAKWWQDGCRQKHAEVIESVWQLGTRFGGLAVEEMDISASPYSCDKPHIRGYSNGKETVSRFSRRVQILHIPDGDRAIS